MIAREIRSLFSLYVTLAALALTGLLAVFPASAQAQEGDSLPTPTAAPSPTPAAADNASPASASPNQPAAESAPTSEPPPEPTPEATPKAAPQPTPEATRTPRPPASPAERIIELRQALERDRKNMASVEATLNDVRSEYNQAEAEFQSLDARLQELAEQLRAAPADDASTTTLALREERKALAERHRLSKERFALSIEERKNQRAQRDLLVENIAKTEEQLARLQGEAPAIPASLAPMPAPPLTAGAPVALPTDAGAPASLPEASASVSAGQPAAATPLPATPSPAPAATPAPAPAAAPSVIVATPIPKPEKTPSREQVAAQKQADIKEREAQEAEREAEDIADRMAKLEEAGELLRHQVETSRQQVENARATRRLLEEELQTARDSRASAEAREEIRDRLVKAGDRLREAQNEMEKRQTELQARQSELNRLQSTQLRALREADRKRLEAEEAQKRAQWLGSFFYWPNTRAWLLDGGVKILGAILMALFFHWMLPVARRKLMFLLAERGEGRASDRIARARTLVTVINNTVLVLVDFAAVLIIFNQIGFSTEALLGGAAIGGLAVAFGAQNLIRDYFTGFVILLENQYAINDVIKVGDKAGLVENITLRMTVLRSLDGAVHFIPNGKIEFVTNMSYGWARAVFDVGISYNSDVDRAIQIVEEIGRDLRKDPKFGRMILEDLTMLGVDQLADSAVVIKFFIKTKPLMQWDIQREMLKRVKKRFDAEGIEIPFPQRTIYHRVQEGDLSAKLLASLAERAGGLGAGGLGADGQGADGQGDGAASGSRLGEASQAKSSADGDGGKPSASAKPFQKNPASQPSASKSSNGGQRRR
jgi:small-conductance mechanosensitive channel